MKKTLRLIAVAIMLFAAINTQAQLYISEILASNASINQDPLHNDNSDWVEIYNAGSEPVDLINYYLTDDFDTPDKWQIPVNVVVEPGGYQLIWCDGSDAFGYASFKLSASGEELALVSPELEIIDSLVFDVQMPDISYGVNEDNPGVYYYFSKVTPGAKNEIEIFEGFTVLYPTFHTLGGFFEDPITVNITCDQGGSVRYTLDGSEPSLEDPEFGEPLVIDQTTVVRARVFEDDKIPGPIITNSYFFGENFEERGLPVVSIATNPENFWDADTGIYVQDFKPDWEVPINIEYFTNDGADRAAFNYSAGTKITGLNSWELPQKMLSIYFRKKYGESKLEYQLFDDSPRNEFKSFSLRAAGSDWSYTLLRDIFGQGASKMNTNVDMMNFKQCIVYVNGKYMGIHNIRERVNDDYVEANYGIDNSDFDMIENEETVENGSIDSYNSFMDLYSKDLSVADNYNAVAQEMDIEMFTDFMITELVSANPSVGHNVMAWKPKQGGQWRWILMDLDRGFDISNDNYIDFFINSTPSPFASLMKSSAYVDYFGKRLAGQLLTSFSPQKLHDELDALAGNIRAEIPYHVKRWEGATSSYGDAISSVGTWENNICDMHAYIDQRSFLLLTDLVEYDFGTPAFLGIKSFPENAGTFTVNGLKSVDGSILGLYPQNMDVTIQANPKAGYEFTGWQIAQEAVLLPRESEWDYLDDGSEPGADWFAEDYSVAGWNSGPAILGFGGNEETSLNETTAGRRPANINSYYFRSTFNVPSVLPGENSALDNCYVNVLWDDGIVLYINGNVVLRMNAGSECSPLNFNETAGVQVPDGAKGTYFTFKIPEQFLQTGINTIAAEVHRGPSSGGFFGFGGTQDNDLLFDLEVIQLDEQNTVSVAEYANSSAEKIYEINGNAITFHQNENIFLIATYEQVSECVIPEIITEDVVLSKDCSPYLVQENVVVESGATLTIEAGVEIYMPEGGLFYVYGTMLAHGQEGDTIRFMLHPDSKGESWGALLFQNTSTVSVLDYVAVENASHGPISQRDVGAISAFNAKLEMSNIRIDNVNNNPIHARLSDIKLSNSYLHSRVTGDLINVKYGRAYIENCDFVGNNMPDTDAIDYDDVQDGVIKNVRIYSFLGSNSDAIDIGERAENVLIDGIFVNNITDKGISVGQLSSAIIKNSIFVNCNLGFGLKDSCKVTADHCVFYNCVQPIASYEKNAGSAGGNAVVTNSIFSNASDVSFYVDDKSSLIIRHSISDNDSLPDNGTNLFGNPYFVAPTQYNFNLQEKSPCIGKASDKSTIGVERNITDMLPEIVISGLSINALNQENIPEYIALFNPATVPQDITGYMVDKGVTITFPEIIIESNETIYLTDTLIDSYWEKIDARVYKWEKGKLSNNGESIRLVDVNGIVIDYINYDEAEWPDDAFKFGVAMELTEPSADNHFAEYWKALPYIDSDNDSVPDAIDECPDDSEKSVAGDCGCFVPEGSCSGLTIALKDGWNLISFNMLPTDHSIEKVFDEIMDNIDVIKNDNGFFKPSSTNYLNSLQSITFESGYFVKVIGGVDFELKGIKSNGISTELNEGWNLMGVPADRALSIEFVLSNSNCSAITIKNFDDYYSEIISNGNLKELQPGKGYYIYVEEECVIAWE